MTSILPKMSLPAHGLVELVFGLGLAVAPFLLDFGATGTVLCFASGVVIVGLGLAAADAFSLTLHRSLDQLVSVLVSAAAVGAAVAGDELASLVLLLVAGTQLALTGLTHWSRRPLGGGLL